MCATLKRCCLQREICLDGRGAPGKQFCFVAVIAAVASSMVAAEFGLSSSSDATHTQHKTHTPRPP